LEQQVKERLTGAGILVVVLVLLVPELLTGPRPVPPPAAAQPDQAPMRSYTMELGASARANSGPVAASTTASPGPAMAAPPSSEPAVVSSAPETIFPTTPVHTAKAPAAPPPAPRPKAAAPSAAPLRTTGGWTVQVGTFSNRENAARLVASLKAHGFSASLSEATRSGHKLFRVRVGAERERAAAQKLQGRLKAAGQKGGEVVPRL
jgi:DedD protein